jgi:hypothetical protein
MAYAVADIIRHPAKLPFVKFLQCFNRVHHTKLMVFIQYIAGATFVVATTTKIQLSRMNLYVRISKLQNKLELFIFSNEFQSIHYNFQTQGVGSVFVNGEW